MEQLYAEAGCKPKTNAADMAKKTGIILLGVFGLYGVLFSGQILFSLVGIAGIIAVVFIYPRLNVEYEYIFCDGQIDFDKIMGGNRRKNIIKIDMDDIEIIGPVKASELSGYQNLKVMDFSSRTPEGNTYAIIGKVKDQNMKILFDPSAKMVEAMRMKSPRKVLKTNW